MEKTGSVRWIIGNCPRLTDWSALDEVKPQKLRIYGDLVYVPERLKGIAEPVNEEIDPGEWWDNNIDIRFSDLEELNSLPDSLLESITYLSMVGDQCAEWNRYEVRRWWKDEAQTEPEAVMYIYDTNEEIPIPIGHMTDLSSLSRLKNLEHLELFCQPLTSLAGIENLPKLKNLELKVMPKLTDTSQIALLPELEFVWMEFVPANSLEWTRSLKNLRSIWMTNIHPQIQDLSPLADCDFSKAYESDGVSLKLDYDQNTVDYAPLASIREYSDLEAGNSEVGKILPLLEGKTVHRLSLNDPDEPVDLSRLPAVSDRLELHRFMDLTDLTGLKAPGPRVLQLDNLPRLTSLNGIRELIGEGGIREIRIGSCPMLTDWSALEGVGLEKLAVFGDLVFVPESLQDKAEYTDGRDEWWDGNVSFSVSSMEELKSLPEALRGSVQRLQIIGDQVWNADRYELHTQWDKKKKKEVPVVYDRETGEETPVETGTMTDLSLLKGMTGLNWLTVAGQPLESLNGIEELTHLQEACFNCCDLQDFSALYALPEIEFIHLEYSGVSSLAGIGANGKLHGLWMNGVKLTDLSPLNECDFEYASEHGGLIFNYDNEKAKDFSWTEKVRYFCDFNVANIDANRWLEAVRHSNIRSLVSFRFPSQKVFAAFVEAHRDIETLWIPWNTKVTDLSMLTELPNLKKVDVSNNMKKAIKSLEGKEYSFEFIIE